MSLVLQPGNYFTVVHQIPNHLDVATYYVKAVIRNAYTDAIINTLLLDNKGSQRFKKDWMVPQDPSGQGFYVSIVTSVYTDSGYTTKSENYGDDENTYLVQDRVLIGRIGGQGGGIDTFDLRRVVKEEMDGLLKAIRDDEKKEDESETPETEDNDRTDEIISLLTAIQATVSKDVEEKDYSPDLAKIDSKLDLAINAIQDKEVTEKTDLEPVLEEIQSIKESIDSSVADMSGNVEKLLIDTSESIGKTVKTAIDDSLAKAKFELTMPNKLDFKLKADVSKEKPLRDITNLEL